MKKEVCLKDFIAGGVVLLLAVVLFFLPLLFGENSDYVRITTEKSKGGKKFDAYIVLDSNCKTSFVFDKNKNYKRNGK